jgi:hypothetical protein
MGRAAKPDQAAMAQIRVIVLFARSRRVLGPDRSRIP